VAPLEHAIYQAGELVRHGGDRFRRTESGAQSTVLGTATASCRVPHDQRKSRTSRSST
jgi:hypothetical protein